jgi:hypothetical protein
MAAAKVLHGLSLSKQLFPLSTPSRKLTNLSPEAEAHSGSIELLSVLSDKEKVGAKELEQQPCNDVPV